ncbi:retrovirus-related pol polyprotein from transposon TNT 1-94 [Tanacetum coccineum]
MAQENYVEGCSMKRPPLLEPNGFCFWKARFETYVKSKDIDLWQVIQNDNFYFKVEDEETKLMKETLYELLKDNEKKQLGKNEEAKMTIYNALPRKEYERIDLLTQEYEKFSISNEETIDSGFTRFNVIVTCLKSLDPDYSSKNHVRKFLRALLLKWRAKVTAIEEAKDLASLPLDELIGNLKVYEMVLDNDGVASKTTKEKVKSLTLKAKVTREQTSDDSDSQGGSDEEVDEEEPKHSVYWLGTSGRDNNFRNKGGESSNPKGACYNCGIEGHFASECRKPKKNKAFVGGSWNDSEDIGEQLNDETCLMAIDSQEVVSKLSSSNYDLNYIDLQKLKKELFKFNKDFTKTFEKLLKEKCSLENENSKLSNKISDLELEVKKLVNTKEIMDSGCTKHMTENKRLFTSYKEYDCGHVVFGSNLKGNVVGGGNISHDFITIKNVEHVSGLAFNLISVGKLCDDDCLVSFTKKDCAISKNNKTLAKGHRRNGLYTCKLGDNSKQQICLASMVDNSTLWHRRLGHVNMRLVQNIASNELVRNLPKLSFERHFCDTCDLGSQGNANNRTRKEVSTNRVLELLHLYLVGPSSIQSYGGNFYTLIIVDDYSNYTWVMFVESKEDVLKKFKILCKKLENLHDCSIVSIATNRCSEFDKLQFGSFCEQHGMSYNLSGPFTSQSNEIVERTNRKLRKMSRAMLDEQSIPQRFRCHALDTSTYIFNRVFGCKVFILNTKVHLTKFDPKSYEEDNRIDEPEVQDLNGSPSLQVNVSDEDPIWEKIFKELEELTRSTYIDECVCCQVQRMMEESLYSLCKEMKDIHININNDLKVLTMIIEDIARVFLQDTNEE